MLLDTTGETTFGKTTATMERCSNAPELSEWTRNKLSCVEEEEENFLKFEILFGFDSRQGQEF